MKTTLFSILLLFGLTSIFNFDSNVIISDKDSIQLRISTPNSSISLSKKEVPSIIVNLFNPTKDTIIIVLPGDGSIDGWRTPIVKWSIIKLGNTQNHPDEDKAISGQRRMRCGNVNGLKLDEIKYLAPNDSLQLNRWVYLNFRPHQPSKYSIKFYYRNDPNIEWKGLGNNDNKALSIVKNESKELNLVSNEIVLTVVE